MLIVFLGIVFTACTEGEKKTEQKLDPLMLAKQDLTAELDSIQQNGQIIGFAVAMANLDGVLYERGFGLANTETNEPYTENTIQHIASVSKTLIGIALMKAYEMGKIQLDDPIENYLPFKVVNPNFPEEKITIWHLATHTSGIQDTEQYMDLAWYLTKDQDLTNVRTDYPEQQLNPNELKIPMEAYLKGYLETEGPYFQSDNYSAFKPGERFHYSNIGATLCALVIEKATGQAYDRFTKTHILDPLGMSSSGWSLEDVDVSMHSRLYRNDYSVLPFYTAITYPDGMLISSSSDMAKYMVELIKGFSGEGTLLKKESYELLFTEQLEEHHFESRNPDHPYDGDYNPAIFIGYSGMGYVGHSGGDAGVATWLYFDQETKTGRYIVINCDMGNDERAKELEYYAIWDTMESYFDKLTTNETGGGN